MLERNETEQDYDFAASKSGKAVKRIIKRVDLFDEICLVKIFVKENTSNGSKKSCTCENGLKLTHFSSKLLLIISFFSRNCLEFTKHLSTHTDIIF